jgi:hypothetical protein
MNDWNKAIRAAEGLVQKKIVNLDPGVRPAILPWLELLAKEIRELEKWENPVPDHTCGLLGPCVGDPALCPTCPR